MRPEISDETSKAIYDLVASAAGESIQSIHINQPRICDHCLDANKEAHPYHVSDANGNTWKDLCNECFDEIAASVDIFFDMPVRKYEPPTKEEIEAAHAEALIDNEYWNETEAKWKANGEKCKCERPISLIFAFYYGICDACIDEHMTAKIWQADHE